MSNPWAPAHFKYTLDGGTDVWECVDESGWVFNANTQKEAEQSRLDWHYPIENDYSFKRWTI